MECVPAGARANTKMNDWIGSLVREGKLDQAIVRIAEGTDSKPDPWLRAQMAERLAGLALEHRDSLLSLEARARAFQADPNPYRLAAYCLDGFPGGLELATRLHAAWEWLQHQPDQAWQAELLLMCGMLTGDVDLPLERLDEAGPDGWQHDVSAVVYPLALVMGCPDLDPPAGSALDAQLRWLAYGAGTEFCSLSWPAYGTNPWNWSTLPQADGVDFMRSFLCRAMGTVAPDQRLRLEALGVASGAMSRRLGWVLGGQHRGQYRHSAMLATACAESYQLVGQPQTAAQILSAIKQAYPRHHRFTRELRVFVDESSVLDWVV